MSRIADSPVAVPAGVEIQVDGQRVRALGPKGALQMRIHPSVRVQQADGRMRVRTSGAGKGARALAGTCRSLLNNMVQGVSQGFERRLQLQGVGYRASVKGSALTLQLGFSRSEERRGGKEWSWRWAPDH